MNRKLDQYEDGRLTAIEAHEAVTEVIKRARRDQHGLGRVSSSSKLLREGQRQVGKNYSMNCFI